MTSGTSRWLDRLADGLALVGVAALAVMMLVTVADVVMRHVFDAPIKGVFALVESVLVLVIFCGVPGAFLRERQIAVDVVDGILSPRGLALVKLGAALLSLVFLVILAWNMVSPALDSWRFGDRKADFPTPIYLLWLVMIIGIALSVVMLSVVALRQMRAMWRAPAA